ELSKEEIKKQMQLDIVGEQTVNQYDFQFEESFFTEKDFYFKIVVPKNIDKEDIVKSVLRITGINSFIEKNETLELDISLRGNNDSCAFLRSNHTKKVFKNSINIEEDIHLSFNSAVKSIVKESEIIHIHLSANKKIDWNKIVFSIFTEKN
ncbi:MAG: hypothetical protein ACRC0V_00300, partial [Fusobacteriaceae bacterium]